MKTRLADWFADRLGRPHPTSEVHFHSGPDSQPAACHDAGCASPRLDV